MRDLLPTTTAWPPPGRPFGRAVVTSVWGSAPRAEGSSMLATADGAMAGSVSGGCVEGATAAEIGEAIERGTPKLVTFGVSDERAWEVGLACGGTIKVFVEPSVRPEVLGRGPRSREARSWRPWSRGRRSAASARMLDDGRIEGDLGAGLSDASRARRRAGRAPAGGQQHDGARRRAAGAVPRVPRGVPAPAAAGDLRRRPHRRGARAARAGARLSHHRRRRAAGVPHPRALPRRRRADPRLARAGVRADRARRLVLRLHPLARSQVRRAGAGARAPVAGPATSGRSARSKTQASRRERLQAAGFDDETVARLHGPIGLDLGGRQPAETALAILAEMTAVRYGGGGGAPGRAK